MASMSLIVELRKSCSVTGSSTFCRALKLVRFANSFDIHNSWLALHVPIAGSEESVHAYSPLLLHLVLQWVIHLVMRMVTLTLPLLVGQLT